MDKASNIINFYMYANILKSKIRTGWKEVKISKDRLESVAEHIYGTLILAIAIDSEYKTNINLEKVMKMLALHELEEILMPDYTVRSNITREQRIIDGKKCVKKITEKLFKQREIEELLDEFNERKTKEAIFCFHVDKIECDFQAKLYDIEGVFDVEEAKKDLQYYGKNRDIIEQKAKRASDFWIEYDRPKYDDDDIFKELLDKIKEIK